jgi:hypothetical protein
MKTRGYFAGEFAITNDQGCFSVGDYIEVTPTANAYHTDETFTVPSRRGGDRTMSVFAIPLTVVLSAHNEPIDVVLKVGMGVTFRHWCGCLEVGKTSVVVPHKFTSRKHSWYMPKIDGWIPHGLFGDKAKAAKTTNRKKNNA